ncbi:TetR/AcrR family transcriptional regulator [Streptomyces sp. NPDC048606]|uniref:TetR/AcrR family transcriptional regulator n=1 Tax=Streptomyces sp. NPDC048606 TaxID=3154726 RepID=UPI00344A0DD9
MTTPPDFQRARSDEQRAARRRAILDTAAAMLAEMPVAQLSLNELSRRVGLAKSNVLRYFESREEILLELLTDATRAFVDHLADTLPAALDGDPSDAALDGESDGAPSDGRAGSRPDRLAALLAEGLAARPVLCDLLSAQAAVLERNVSAQVAARYKRAAIDTAGDLGRIVARHLPELGEYDAFRFVAGAVMVAGAVWTHAHPSAAMLAAYASDPELAVLRVDFTDTLRQTLEVLLSGLLARAGREPGA